MKKFLADFKEFISRGNVIDMSVGIIIGASFKAIVDSLVGDIISPLIGLMADTNFSELCWNIGGVSIGYGSFVTAIINFLIMALVLFMLIRGINAIRCAARKREEAAESETAPATKQCPFCKSEIAIDATRCAHCTSELK